MKKATKEIVIYQGKSGAIELKGDFKHETIWATQAQIANVFNIERSVVTKHINKILKSKEVSEKSNVQKMHIANSDKPVAFYSLGLILAVGYRTNSKKAIEFRQWATKTLRQHILEGYTINRKIVAKNYDQFLKAFGDVKKLLPSGGQVGAQDAMELMKAFASTWFSLEAYDKETSPKKGATKKQVKITADGISKALLQFKEGMIAEKEAGDLFGIERAQGNISGIVGNIFQSFGGKELYPTLE